MRRIRDLTYTPLCGWLLHWPLLVYGVVSFRLTGRTPWLSYWAMRRLYCITQGRSNRVLVRWLSKASGEKANESSAGPTQVNVESAVATLQRDGFAMLGNLLSVPECEELTAFALATPATLTPAPTTGPRHSLFDPLAPSAVKYDLPEELLVQHPIVQRLLAHPFLQALAGRYLGCAPVNDLVAMWWSAPSSGEASSEAAQLYHFDMDRPQFLKIFFYLSDVTADTGPHCYIRASHRDRPSAFWRDARHNDGLIVSQHGAQREVEICGPRGTTMAVDTSGFHKGKPLRTGHRLILQLEYTSALFGQRYRALQVPADRFWREQLLQSPRYYSRFSFADGRLQQKSQV